MADTTRSKQSSSRKAAADNNEEQNNAGTASVAGDTGPGTGAQAPEDTQERTPDRAVAQQTDAAPLVAPDAGTQTQPRDGYAESSTNPVSSASGLRTEPGNDHHAIVGESGEELDPNDLFEDPGGPQTYVTVKHRTYEQFRRRGARQLTTQLLFPKGKQVQRGEAARITAAFSRTSQEATFERKNA